MRARLVLAAMLIGALIAPAAADAGAAPVAVRVIRVESRAIEIYASYPGTVIPAEYVQVASRMSGYVEDIKVHVGQSVTKGELLLTVNPVQVAAGVRRARAQEAKARAALDTARKNYERFKALYADGAIPKARLEQVQLAYAAAGSDYQAAQAAVQQARSQIGYAEVRAPFDGVIFSKKISNGQLVGPGKELMVLYNPKQLQIHVQVADAAYYALELGKKIPVEYLGSDRAPHRIDAIVQRLVAASDPMTHTHTVKLLLPPDSGAQGGEYARVMIPVRRTPAIVVPEGALRDRAGITGVFVVDAHGRARFRMVNPGERRAGGVVILSGLFPGDRVVVSSERPLANGVEVRTTGGGT